MPASTHTCAAMKMPSTIEKSLSRRNFRLMVTHSPNANRIVSPTRESWITRTDSAMSPWDTGYVTFHAKRIVMIKLTRKNTRLNTMSSSLRIAMLQSMAAEHRPGPASRRWRLL